MVLIHQNHLFKRTQSLYLQVIYHETAHHQHVYDEHDEGWGGSGSGSYWKRSLAAPLDSNSAENVPITNTADRINIGYNRPVIQTKQNTSPLLSSSNYRPATYEDHSQLASYNDPHNIVYSQQIPQQTYIA